MSNSNSTTYDLPERFWEDHLDRGCRCSDHCLDQSDHETDGIKGWGIKTAKGIRVELTDLDAAELLSDALHYSDAVRMMGPDYLGIQSSARATVRRMQS